ncbi:uncharacterized protein GGS22DRAFT_189970 [Annulohypoxylon maeteangense]|uniref:uncharacterized protein n=1 Tax=Annulohypoxylon maeteangense TaxID=1927788 RepID=UPI002008023E|nr:uncharacterized protein GGS22DRAFT_189970 [Annulohypoxylon maeteangense]KAI0884004.1 hypothetical protein GGS22DRAFT_189970 [Annulohypoxylon maeteangense]
MSPDSSSSLYPDRPIRPLPKRRLRERLSPDVADTIQYPPAPQTTAPLFAYPYNSKEDLASLGIDPPNVAHRENAAELGQEASARRNGMGVEQDDQSLIGQARRALISRPLHDSPGHAVRAPLRQSQPRQPNPQPPPSTASSVDGYDSFENSNNKKKRKIPTAGETILNGTHVLNDLGTLGVSSPTLAGDDGSLDASGAASAPYYQTGGAIAGAQGLSGPGRGRYGRTRNGRSPLRALSDPNSNWGNRNSNKHRSGGIQYPSSPAVENSGIISSAIASAEKLQVPQGQENISLLHQETSTKPSPASAQFTFTFDSQNPVSWPGSDPAPSSLRTSHPLNRSSRTMSTAGGIGTTGSVPNGSAASSTGSGDMPSGANAIGNESGRGPSQASAAPKKPKRRGNSLLLAAKQRRRETAFQNFHHPPAADDIWICEFCEYERIFGRAPEALIRQYEIKDRRRRREEAERRRLLEKAKMKSRKGKKANKLPAKNNSASADRHTTSGQQTSQHQLGPNDQDDDQALHQRQIHEEDQEELGYDSEDNYEDHGPEAEPPGTIPALAQGRGGRGGSRMESKVKHGGY